MEITEDKEYRYRSMRPQGTTVPWIWFTYSRYGTKCTQPCVICLALTLLTPHLGKRLKNKPPWPHRHKTFAAASKPPSHQPPATRYSRIPSSAIAAAIWWPTIRLIVVYSPFLSTVARQFHDNIGAAVTRRRLKGPKDVSGGTESIECLRRRQASAVPMLLRLRSISFLWNMVLCCDALDTKSQNIASKEDNNKEEIEENKKSNTAVTEQHMNDENTTENVDTAIEGGSLRQLAALLSCTCHPTCSDMSLRHDIVVFIFPDIWGKSDMSM
eukprot:scaffold75200_cov76-Cyclotella_meneghiniana.AAC.4